VNPQTPAKLGIGRQALTLLEAVLEAAAPEEGWALLLGSRDPWSVQRIWPCLNVWEPAAERGRRTRPGIKLGICGEHGGDPASVEFCHRAGLDYVSCSPYRVPIARLAAAQAALKDSSR
jgi:hypothetical protein